MYAFNAGITHQSLKGLDQKINPEKRPRKFRDVMKVLDKQAWAAAYNSEYLGFKQREVFKIEFENMRAIPKDSAKRSLSSGAASAASDPTPFRSA